MQSKRKYVDPVGLSFRAPSRLTLALIAQQRRCGCESAQWGATSQIKVSIAVRGLNRLYLLPLPCCRSKSKSSKDSSSRSKEPKEESSRKASSNGERTKSGRTERVKSSRSERSQEHKSERATSTRNPSRTELNPPGPDLPPTSETALPEPTQPSVAAAEPELHRSEGPEAPPTEGERPRSERPSSVGTLQLIGFLLP
jgi:cobalamin biosynthesis Mg chelatase CobN